MRFKLNELSKKAQEQILHDYPDLFRAVEAKVAKPNTTQAMDGGISKQAGGVQSMEICVVFVALIKRKLDDDNLIAALKPLRDAICTTIGIDDGSDIYKFYYEQQVTIGQEGVLVHISK
jgi:hypothetical protein